MVGGGSRSGVGVGGGGGSGGVSERWLVPCCRWEKCWRGGGNQRL